MGITPRFSSADLNKMFAIRLQRVEEAIISRLMLVGETFVNNAREQGDYKDQTGNLRSSIGYIVMKNGRTLHQDFEVSSKGSDKTTGVNQGKNMIKEIRSNFKTGYVLIVVAGMEYAAAVESKGKDVLTASAITAKNDLKLALTQITRKVRNL